MKDGFIISILSRDDLETLGYNSSVVSDKDMERIASKLADNYHEEFFWLSLEVFAKMFKIPKHEIQ